LDYVKVVLVAFDDRSLASEARRRSQSDVGGFSREENAELPKRHQHGHVGLFAGLPVVSTVLLSQQIAL
jgi:hypothetical protein